MFCVECGKEKPIYKDGVCINCYVKSHSFTSGPGTIDIPICTNCGSYKYKSTWHSDIFTEFFRKVIKNNFKISKELQKVDIDTKCEESDHDKRCKVFISGLINDTKVIDEHDVIVRLKKTVCDVCSKKFGGYHEAVVQIRAEKRKLSKGELKDIVLLVETMIDNIQSKGNRTIFIADVSEEHGGINFYISDKAAGLIIAKKIQEQYGGKIKQSSKNIGMKDSRQIYRMTYLIRLPFYKKDEFIELDNEYYCIESTHANKIKLINMSNWEEITVESNKIKKEHFLGGKELIKEMILVSQTEEEIQIMNQKNYEIKTIKKPKSVPIDSEKVKIVKIKDQLFLFYK
jgi:nonsense-mediated mRNA decay protein 3